jgi:cytochrome c oxidase subunit 2
VLFFVFLILCFLCANNNIVVLTEDYQIAELLCGIIPIFVLIMQIVPSLSLLYFFGLMRFDRDLTVKIVGHQWYWRYDYSDFPSVSFDSYMKTTDILNLGEKRNLGVDNRCVLPCGLNICLCVTSYDVIHSWTLFNYFIKMDAMRGILNVFHFNFPIIGVFYGQCSEICGANHSFIPVVVEVTLFKIFKFWCISWIF